MLRHTLRRPFYSADGAGGDAGARTFTQEEVNRLLGDRVAREREKFADYDALKARVAELEGAATIQTADLEARLADAEGRLRQAESAACKQRELAKTGLSPDLERWVRGDTAEEIAADVRLMVRERGGTVGGGTTPAAITLGGDAGDMNAAMRDARDMKGAL